MASTRVEVLILNCGGNLSQLHTIASAPEVARIACLRSISFPLAAFNKSLALNLGLLRSRGENVLVLDNDIVLSPQSFDDLRAQLTPSTFVTVRDVRETRPDSLWLGPAHRNGLDEKVLTMAARTVTLTFQWHDGTSVEIETAHHEGVRGIRSGPGLLMVHADSLRSIGGYNSGLESWGSEDTDVNVRLTKVAHLKRVQAGTATHQSHAAESGRRGRSASNLSNLNQLCVRYSKGQFLGTLDEDRARYIDFLSE